MLENPALWCPENLVDYFRHYTNIGNRSEPALGRVPATYNGKKQGAEAGRAEGTCTCQASSSEPVILGTLHNRGQILPHTFDHSNRVTGPIPVQPFQQTWHRVPQDRKFSEYCNDTLLLLFDKGCMR